MVDHGILLHKLKDHGITSKLGIWFYQFLTNRTHSAIMGDFYLNRIVWNPEPSVPDELDEDAPERLFIDCLQDTYSHQHVAQPTRFREGQRPTYDDLILTTDEGDISDISYSPGIGKSDHIIGYNSIYTLI